MRAVMALVTCGLATRLVGCSESIESDPDLGAVAEWAFANHDSASDQDVAAKVAQLEKLVATSKADGALPVQVRIDSLTAADLGAVHLASPMDPARAPGVVVVTEVTCTLDQIETLVIARNQSELYPQVFDAYTRTYLSSSDDYLARRAPTLSFGIAYSATTGGTRADVELAGDARYVPRASPLKGGAALLVRFYQPHAAVVHGGAGDSWNQDYQTDLYYERAPGTVIHVTALWAEFRLGSSTLENDVVAAFTMGSLVDTDTRTGKICQSGQPVPVTSMN
jgi:hypothetical protein